MTCCPHCGQALERQAQTKRYRYTESGLSNVFLEGMRIFHCSACKETFPQIGNVPALHAKIAEILLKKPYVLTGREFRFLRKEMRMKSKDLASWLGVTPTTVSRWENEEERIGVANDRLIRSLYLMWQLEQDQIVDPKAVLGRMGAQFQMIKSTPKAVPIHIPGPQELFATV